MPTPIPQILIQKDNKNPTAAAIDCHHVITIATYNITDNNYFILFYYHFANNSFTIINYKLTYLHHQHQFESLLECVCLIMGYN